MFKFLMAVALCFGACVAQANNVKFINGDGTPWTATCIAALESHDAMLQAIKAAGLSKQDANELYCNGMPIDRFVSKYQAKDGQAASVQPAKSAQLRVTGFLFSKADDSFETRLCLAAVSSADLYTRLLSEHFGADRKVEDTVLCNNMTLKAFVRKYRSPTYTASLR